MEPIWKKIAQKMEKKTLEALVLSTTNNESGNFVANICEPHLKLLKCH